MTESPKCNHCGRPLPGGSKHANCPSCFLELGLGDSTGETTQIGGATLADKPVLPAPARLTYFGDYELLEEVARGGMGVVYRARQVSLNRIVAVKMILAGHFAGKEAADRFKVEAEAAARLRHPHIVGIHEVGMHEGFQYFSMDYIAGPNLGEAGRLGPLSAKKAAEWVKTVAQAIHYAHEQGILHRDIKPSNILIDASGQPHVTDFGLAKQMTDASELTLSGQVIGSPNYMPPEQAEGHHGRLTRTADVYSLGAVLFYLITGRPPFVGQDVAQTLHRVIHEELTSPRLLNPNTPEDLQTICLKCLEKDSSRRYPTAQALADELDRFLHDEPIQARPISGAEKAWRWCRRKPAVAGLLASLLLAIILGAAGVLWQLHRVQVKSRESEEQLARLNILTGAELLQSGDALKALLWFAAALPDATRGDKVEDANRMRVASVLEQAPQLVQLISHDGQSVSSASFSPIADIVATVGQDGTLRTWDIVSGKELLRTEPLKATPYSVTFDASGRYLCIVLLNNQALVVDATSGLPLGKPVAHTVEGARTSVLPPHFGPQGSRLAVQSSARTIEVLDLKTLTPAGPPLSHAENIEQLAFNSDSSQLFVRTEGSHNFFWAIATGDRVSFPDPIPDNQVPYCAERAGLMLVGNRLWNWNSGRFVRTLEGIKGTATCAAFSSSAHRLFVAKDDREAGVFDCTTGRRIGSFAPEQPIWSGVFSPDGVRVLLGSAGNLGQVWDATASEAITTPFPYLAGSEMSGFSASGRFFGTVHPGHFIAVWALRKPATPAALVRPPQLSASQGVDSRDVVLTTESGGPIRYVSLSQSAQNSLHPISLRAQARQIWFAESNRFVVLQGARAHLQIWDSASGLPLTPVFASAFAPNNTGSLAAHLPSTSLSRRDLMQLAELLSGNRLDGTGGWSQLDDLEISERWSALRNKHPGLFTMAREDLFLWHRHEAALAAACLDWEAAAFHAEMLLRHNPADPLARADLERFRAAQVPALSNALVFPPRDRRASAKCLDLSRWYNASLRSHLPLDRSPASFRAGFQELGGIPFDVRGSIALFGQRLEGVGAHWPAEMRGLNVQQRAKKLHFLHHASFGQDEGIEIARIVVHYADGGTETIPLLTQVNVASDWFSKPSALKEGEVVWVGMSRASDAADSAVRLSRLSWSNPHPDREISTLDLISAQAKPGYVLFAVTVD